MRRSLLVLLGLAWAAPALAAAYHLEFLRGNHGPALVDCAHGFAPALQLYFEQFARADGLPVQGPAEVKVESPDSRISRFRATVEGRIFRGFVFLDPTMTEGDEEPEEGASIEVSERVCSMVFVDDAATAEEQALVDQGFHSTIRRLELDDSAPEPVSGRRR